MPRKGVLCFGLGVLLMLAAPTSPRSAPASAPVPAPAPTTVGTFAVKLAAAFGYDTPDPVLASRIMRIHGLDLRADLSAPLDEGEAAHILGSLGVSVVPSNDPLRPVSENKATALAGLAATVSNHGVSVESGNLGGIGDIVACLHSASYGDCVSCCEGEIPGRLGRIICQALCKLNQPPSPSGSTPH